MFKTLFPVAIGVASLCLLLGACTGEESWVILPVLSPPVAAVAERPLERAENVAKTVPNSFVLIAHGSATFPLYPTGTVLVVQAINWKNLKPGMTAIYYLDRELSAAAVTGGIITRQEDEIWHVPQIESWHAPGTGSHAPVSGVTKDNYIGVVVAAFIEQNLYDPNRLLREAPPDVTGTCILRCHVGIPQ